MYTEFEKNGGSQPDKIMSVRPRLSCGHPIFCASKRVSYLKSHHLDRLSQKWVY